MDSGFPFDLTAPLPPNDDFRHFVPFDLALPPLPTPTRTSLPQNDNISFDELSQKHAALQSSYSELLSNFFKMKSKNDYFTKVLHYVEKGLAMKVAEIGALKRENQQLKVRQLYSSI